MTSSNSRYAYALTRCAAEPLEGLPQREDDRQKSRSSKKYDDLARIYQSYAEMYPNPLLIRERLERDRLLQEIRQEIREERLQDEQHKPLEDKKDRPTILSYLFGSFKTSKPDLAVTEKDDLIEEDYLMYSDNVSGDLQDNDALCGTQSVLDPTCIPLEAHAMARFHMSSPSSPIAVRRDPSHSILLITALGVIAELVADTWTVRYTSDRQHWERHLGIHPNEFRKTRATCVGSDCVAIAWGGMHDVLFYRRASSGWEALAYFPPTPAVIDNLHSQSHVYENNDALRVTDVATLRVETAGGGVAATLVVSRLGGYMELLPLAEQLWQTTDPKRKKRAAELYCITSDNSNIASLTLSEHLDDLLHLELHRTDVSFDSEWDSDGENPPAEYLMVASGSQAGQEKLTFWAVATVLSEDPAEAYGLHVMFLGVTSIGAIGRATVFANHIIMENWRRPRRVERKRHAIDQSQSPTATLLGTLSVAAPVVAMRFNLIEKGLLLSVLDWNGGLVVLDCTVALKRASQTIPRDVLSDSTGDIVLTAVSRVEIWRNLSSQLMVDAAWSNWGDLVLVTHANTLGIIPVSVNSRRSISSPLLTLPVWMTGYGKLIGSCEQLMLLLPLKSSLVATVIQPSNPVELATTSHKRLWEQTRQVDSLALVPDDVYVIEQVYALFRGQLSIEGLDMASCIKACDLALAKLSAIRVASALRLMETTENLNAYLSSWSVRAGTYSLLCQHFGADEVVSTFLSKFLNEPLVDLAAELAAKGDIEGLAILAARHTGDLLSSRLSLLEKAPFSIDASRICHLLPCNVPSDDSTWSISRTQQMQEVLGARPSDDEGILLYCASLLEKENVCDDAVAFNSIRESVGAIAAFAKASRSSLPISLRMIKNRMSVMELFLTVVEHVGYCCRKFQMRPDDARSLHDKLWQMYECLPESIAQHENDDQDLVQITRRVDSAFRKLVATDILINWSPSDALSFLSCGDVCGSDIASEMCNSFCKDISGGKAVEWKLRRLRDLTCDLVLLRRDACKSSLDLGSPVHDILLVELLQLGEFDMFAEVFSTELGDIANWERIQPAVLNFVNEIMMGDSSSRLSSDIDRVQLAIQCQDVLASRFPRLQDRFRGMRRHLDAAHFINSVLSPDAKNLSPSELRDMVPFDVVEHILRENPLCIFQGSKGWEEQGVGRARNREMIKLYLSRKDPGASIDVPALPGDRVLQLASIVGLDSRLSKFVVRSRVAHFAQQVSMTWVTTGLAIAMLVERDASAEENEITMATIAQVVSMQSDDDVRVHAALCREALKLSPIERSASLDAVMDAFGRLEHKVSRFCPLSWKVDPSLPSQNRQDTQGNSDFLVFRAVGLLANTALTMANDPGAPTVSSAVLDRVLAPRLIDRVFKDTLSAYSADLNNLFQILQSKASQGARDDPLLIAIGRFILFWCISNSVRIIDHTSQGTFEQADAFENLTLAASVLLHSRDKEAVASNVSELKSIAEQQSLSAIERVAAFPRPSDVRPDLAIVRKLMELGYTENGARRAAAATNNESQHAAMAWAVAHSLEPQFNSPMVLVRRPSPHIDQSAIIDFKRCIDTVSLHFDGLDGPISAPAASPSTMVHSNSQLLTGHTREGSMQNRRSVVPIPPAGSVVMSNTRTAVGAPAKDRGNAVAKVGSIEGLKTKSTMASNSVRPREASSIIPNLMTGKHGKLDPGSMNPISAGSSCADKRNAPPHPPPESDTRKAAALAPSPLRIFPPPAEVPPTSFQNKPHPPPPKSLASSTLNRAQRLPPSNIHEAVPVDTGVATLTRPVLPQGPPTAPRSAPPLLNLDRSNLRKTGESVRQSSRGLSSRLDDDERRRLLSKGRELFQHVRSSPTASRISPGASSLSSQNRPMFEIPIRADTNVPAPPRPAFAAERPEVNMSSLLPDNDDDLQLDDGADGWDFEDF
jgi:hypothetical protein